MPAEQRSDGSGRRSVFVYYTLDAARSADLLQAVARLARTPTPWQVQLMRRAPAQTAAQTWMEVYTLDSGERREPDEWVQLIETRAREAGILDLVDSHRHYEVFDTCA